MADPFQPRFADLVRNYTSTSGTGNFTLGPAVNGFTGFGSALEVGESFYYSAIGVDKPAEREVGRGTLLSNGQISREPITGPKTNFTTGTKSIALIAAAEWFERVESGTGGGGSAASATRPQLAAAPSSQAAMLLAEAGREGLFVFDGSNLSAKVSADPNQGIYVPPTGGNGSTGAWVRKVNGRHNVKWFGAVGDDVTNDGAAFTAALAYLNAIAISGYGYGMGTPELFIPAGKYYLGTTTLDITHSIIVTGENGADAGGGSTILRWAAGATGIRTQAANTTGATGTQAPAGYRGDGSIIRNLFLQGGYAGVEAEFHGIHLRAKATIRDCYITNFQGDGVYANATAGSGGASEGNVNCFEFTRLIITGNRNGVYLIGADTNAGSGNYLDVFGNRAWGINDNSFLGNTWTACHTASNISGPYRSTNLNAHSVFVGCYSESDQPAASFSQRSLVLGGLHAAGVGTAAFLRAEGNDLVADGDLSVVGIATATLFNSTNGYLIANSVFADISKNVAANTATLTGALNVTGSAGGSGEGISAYYFSGEGYINAINWAGTVWKPLNFQGSSIKFLPAGTLAATINATGLNLVGTITASNFSGTSSGTNTGDQTITLTGDVTGSGTESFATTIGAGKVTLAMQANMATGSVVYRKSAGSGAPEVQTLATLKTDLALAGIASSGSGADLTAATVTYAKIQNVAASRLLGNPTGGATAASEISLAGGLSFSGATLTAAGALTPTSVASTGAIKSSGTGGVGYAAGAGASVTQLTSKSTAPPAINKDCGQIVTNNAALAAAAMVSFTVSNSEVAATDTINLNLQSGNATAGAYRYWIDKVSAGSFVVAIENRSGGSLSEALVFTFAVLKAVTT
jgi:hypothetical protein